MARLQGVAAAFPACDQDDGSTAKGVAGEAGCQAPIGAVDDGVGDRREIGDQK
jgi:hypothetical protein